MQATDPTRVITWVGVEDSGSHWVTVQAFKDEDRATRWAASEDAKGMLRTVYPVTALQVGQAFVGRRHKHPEYLVPADRAGDGE